MVVMLAGCNAGTAVPAAEALARGEGVSVQHKADYTQKLFSLFEKGNFREGYCTVHYIVNGREIFEQAFDYARMDDLQNVMNSALEEASLKERETIADMSNAFFLSSQIGNAQYCKDFKLD